MMHHIFVRIAHLQPYESHMMHCLSVGIAYLQTTQSVVSHMLNSPCSASSMQTDAHIDWLHTNPTYERQKMDVHGVFDSSEGILPGLVVLQETSECFGMDSRNKVLHSDGAVYVTPPFSFDCTCPRNSGGIAP